MNACDYWAAWFRNSAMFALLSCQAIAAPDGPSKDSSLAEWKRDLAKDWNLRNEDSVILKEEKERRYLADKLGNVVCELSRLEEIVDASHSESGEWLLLLSFVRHEDIHIGIALDYFRIIRLRKVGTEKITAEPLLAWNHKFMGSGKRSVSKIYSVSDDGNVACVKLRESSVADVRVGVDTYRKVSLRLVPPAVLSSEDDDKQEKARKH